MSSTDFDTAAIMGATGLVGRHLLPLVANEFARAKVYGRRPPEHLPTNAEFVETHFTDAETLDLTGVQQAFITFGTTKHQAGSAEEFRRIDLELPLNFARAAKRAGVKRLFLVSAVGADTESWVFYNRVKGELEQALQAMGFDTLVIVRPSLLIGEHPGRMLENFGQMALIPFARFMPATMRPIEAGQLAQAMINSARQAPEGEHLLMGADIWTLVKD